MSGRFELRCYVCGKPTGKRFVLVVNGERGTKATSADRAFTVHEKCAKQLDDIHTLTVVVP